MSTILKNLFLLTKKQHLEKNILVYLLFSVTRFWPWFHSISLCCDADVALNVTFDPGADVTRVGQHGPFIHELVTWDTETVKREGHRSRMDSEGMWCTITWTVVVTWLFVDRPHVQLKGADTETPQHLRVHHLERRRAWPSNTQHTWNKVKKQKKTFAFSFPHRELDDFVEEDLFVGKEVKHEILMDRAGATFWSQQLKHTHINFNCFVICVYSDLIVERSVGSFFDGRLFLLVTDLNHHTGVDVFPHQLPRLRDVNSNLRDGQA